MKRFTLTALLLITITSVARAQELTVVVIFQDRNITITLSGAERRYERTSNESEKTALAIATGTAPCTEAEAAGRPPLRRDTSLRAQRLRSCQAQRRAGLL